jgi:cytochrome c biogenesis protein CcmG/thiol:disulfide interchange protein DsbE
MLAVMVAAGAAGCTAQAQPPAGPTETPAPFADCAVLTSGSSPAGRPADGLPDLALPCFTGGRPVRLADLRGPAVINLWASWCAPCRTELPAMQRLAGATAGRLRVVGVDTGDSRAAAASFGADAGVTLPILYDRDKTLINTLGRSALPVTIFLDGAGRTYVYDRPAPDKAGLARLVHEHTGVTVTG